MPQFSFVYVYTIATNAPAAAPRLMAASGDRSNGTLPTSKTSPGWPGSIEIPQIWKFMPTRSKRLEKLLFASTNDSVLDGIAHCFTFLLSLATAFVFIFDNNFSTTLIPTEKPKYTYCKVFVDYIYSKTIDVIRKLPMPSLVQDWTTKTRCSPAFQKRSSRYFREYRKLSCTGGHWHSSAWSPLTGSCPGPLATHQSKSDIQDCHNGIWDQTDTSTIVLIGYDRRI